MHVKSIIGSWAARELGEALRDGTKVSATVASGNHVYALRACTIGGKRSGGCEVSVSLNMRLEHASPVNLVIRRLLPDMDEDRIVRALSQCDREVREKSRLVQQREAAYQLIGSMQLSEAQIQRLESVVSSPIYSEMTAEDCQALMREGEKIRTGKRSN